MLLAFEHWDAGPDGVPQQRSASFVMPCSRINNGAGGVWENMQAVLVFE